MRRPLRQCTPARGFTLIVFLSLVVAGALAFLLATLATLGPEAMEAWRARKTDAALAQARDALVGFAVTYRDAHPGQVFGYLPCPDSDNDGIAELNCAAENVTVVGRLPWRTLGLPDLRDGYGECLWYVVSGHFKYNPKTDSLNWDTVSQVELKDASGQTLMASGEHSSPIAVVLAPGPSLNQDRSPVGNTLCGGNLTVGSYLEGLAIFPTAEVDGDNGTRSTVTVGTYASALNGTHNDRGITLSSKDVFDPVMQRSDFKNDIDVRLLDGLEGCLNALPLLPDAAGSKGVDNVFLNCAASVNTLSEQVQSNWKDNLLYAKAGATKFTINSVADCDGVIAFSGARETGEPRRDPTERADVGNYLTDANVATFPGNASGGAVFDPSLPAQDVFRCIKPSGPIILSFDNNIDQFQPAGSGLTIDKASNPNHPSVEITPSGTFRGGCIWYPNAIPVKDRVWRVFYRSQFLLSDPIGGSDAGYGFTFQIVTTEPGMAPNTCGRTTSMGALSSFTDWGSTSVIFETDIYRNLDSPDHNDPAGNHFAIMANGVLEHSSSNGNPTTACDGSRAGCILDPQNTFEESPTPTEHAQRIEIQTGCNSSCSDCSIAGSFARLKAWVDCSTSACTDLTSDLPTTPTVQRCIPVPTDLDLAYFGFTGGFNQIGSESQGVTIWDFHLRAE